MKVLLLTPPFTQINTPYPATAFLKRFLDSKGLIAAQADLGIELVLSVFSKDGLRRIFESVNNNGRKLADKHQTVLNQANRYLYTIETVTKFLQSKETALAYSICQDGFLPRAESTHDPSDLEWMFGNLGIVDKACYLATQYLNELFGFIKSEIDPEFGFSRYAEQIALSATEFMPIVKKLQNSETIFDSMLQTLLVTKLTSFEPDLVALSVPFPGCLLGALKSGKIIKALNPHIKIVLGGGYVSTELRDLRETAVFDYTDFVVLDQGEIPLLQIAKYISGEEETDLLSRTYIKENGSVRYYEGNYADPTFGETGYPDYQGLDLDRYLSIVEIPNPMHRLWNDGKWNKMMIAKGCYWKKCAFCDVTLDYISAYETIPASTIVDRIEEVMLQTGQSGFHFVDEAAPPAALKNIALELLNRGLNVSWWTNIRFEKNFSPDLCRLMAKSGCIAVSGGLETVSDRLLDLMSKGVNIAQATEALSNFSKAGILVHAYLMYGFPTQTAQETIDSLEVIRQFFENELLDSCYWHRFALTVHSPIAANPERFNIKITGPPKRTFAWNDLEHEDKMGCDHDTYAFGLKKAVYNYMQKIGIEYNLQEWFETQIPQPTVAPQFIELLLESQKEIRLPDRNKQLIWLGNKPELVEKKSKKNILQTRIKLIVNNKEGAFYRKIEPDTGQWLCQTLDKVSVYSNTQLTVNDVSNEYEQTVKKPFQDFVESDLWQHLRRFGLIAV